VLIVPKIRIGVDASTCIPHPYATAQQPAKAEAEAKAIMIREYYEAEDRS
jgi:hypothetical protein